MESIAKKYREILPFVDQNQLIDHQHEKENICEQIISKKYFCETINLTSRFFLKKVLSK